MSDKPDDEIVLIKGDYMAQALGAAPPVEQRLVAFNRALQKIYDRLVADGYKSITITRDADGCERAELRKGDPDAE